MTPPRTVALMRWAARTFGADAARRVFEPLVADWQHDAAAAPTRAARAVAHARGALAFVSNSVLLLARGGGHRSPQATRLVNHVIVSAVAAGSVQGLLGFAWGAAPERAPIIAAGCALSMLPPIAVVHLHRRWRFARRWRALAVMTAGVAVAQGLLITFAWTRIASPASSAAPWPWQLNTLIASVLPGVLGVALARACSRRVAVGELTGAFGAYSMLAWSEATSALGPELPVFSSVLAFVLLLRTRHTIVEDDRRRRQHRERRARRGRLWHAV